MNILFINEYDWFEPVVFDIHVFAEGLSLLGHQVYAVDPGGWPEKTSLRFVTSEDRDVSRVYPGARVHLRSPRYMKLPSLGQLPTAFIPGAGLLSIPLSRYVTIRKTIKEGNIDVIVLYSAFRSGLQAVYLARRLRIPIVFRNIDIFYNLTSNSRQRRVRKFFEKKVYPQMDAVLALTPRYAEYLKAFGADESKTRLLLFPLDTELFRPGVDCFVVRQKWGIREEDKVIVFVGSLYKFGGLDDFIRQFPQVIEQVPEAKLLIVGDGPQRPELVRIISELGLTGRVIITAGYEPFQTMPQYINLGTICINAFPINDNTRDLFSAKIIQYLACGKATVSTSLPGITTLIPGESCGVVYADTAADMATEVISLLKSPQRREQLGQAGLEYVRQNHSYDKVTRQLETCLEEVIKEKRNTAGPKRV